VVCFGLAPAVQRSLLLERFRVGEVNRARKTQVSVGGKAVNAGLALAVLGRSAVVTGLNGGDPGRFIERFLRERGVETAFTRAPWPTRTCTTIQDAFTGSTTELVEEARTPSQEDLRRFERAARALLKRASLALICGALPPGVPVDFWFRMADASRHLALLRALSAGPLLCKMNVGELAQTVAEACRTEAEILAAARRLTAAGAGWVLVTHGAEAAILAAADGRAWRVLPPTVQALSPIGSGDCALAGLAHAFLNGASMPDAARFGLACGSANARTLAPADFDAADAEALDSACEACSIA
jgi:1-phosphofructokinase family hexose kinase